MKKEEKISRGEAIRENNREALEKLKEKRHTPVTPSEKSLGESSPGAATPDDEAP